MGEWNAAVYCVELLPAHVEDVGDHVEAGHPVLSEVRRTIASFGGANDAGVLAHEVLHIDSLRRRS